MSENTNDWKALPLGSLEKAHKELAGRYRKASTYIFDLLFRVYFISFTLGQEINGRKKMEKNDITHAYREKKTKPGNPINVGFPISPLVTSLHGEFP